MGKETATMTRESKEARVDKRMINVFSVWKWVENYELYEPLDFGGSLGVLILVETTLSLYTQDLSLLS